MKIQVEMNFDLMTWQKFIFILVIICWNYLQELWDHNNIIEYNLLCECKINFIEDLCIDDTIHWYELWDHNNIIEYNPLCECEINFIKDLCIDDTIHWYELWDHNNIIEYNLLCECEINFIEKLCIDDTIHWYELWDHNNIIEYNLLCEWNKFYRRLMYWQYDTVIRKNEKLIHDTIHIFTIIFLWILRIDLLFGCNLLNLLYLNCFHLY